MLAGITNKKNFLEVKGIIERLFKDYYVSEDPLQFITTYKEAVLFEIPYELILKKTTQQKTFTPIPKYPPIIEDLALIVPKNIPLGDIIKTIKDQSNLIKDVSLLDVYSNTKTFHIIYQHSEKNLTNEEVSGIRRKIIKNLEEKWRIKIKE